MDTLRFKIIKNDYLIIDGINFSNSIFIKPIINDEDIIEKSFFGESLAPLSEWEKSSENSGHYLLFTSLIGVADDGGWELCKVSHEGRRLSVEIKFDDFVFHYEFDKAEFYKIIEQTKIEVKSFLNDNKSFHLEPSNIVFPEK